MCGIYGRYCFNSYVNVKDSLSALNKQIHRGPDGFGYEYGDFSKKTFNIYHNEEFLPEDTGNVNYFLGHRRLSIVDLNENAFQPISSIDSSCSIVFNGEIYNYIELKKELEGLGFKFKTDHSDTEVLLNAYLKWGVNCLDKLRGMFAFAIFDKRKNNIFLARDRVGIKPLYYSFNKEEVFFSSDLRSISHNFSYELHIDEVALSQYLTYGYVPSPRSIFKGINKLPPAHYAIIDLEEYNLNIVEYWDLDISQERSLSLSDFERETDNNLTEAVKLHMRADVPFGLFTSGGIDSTLILKKVAELGITDLNTFAADFPDERNSDLKSIELVNNKYRTNLHLLMVGESDVQSIESIFNVFDEPFDGGSSIALFKLFEKIQGNYKIMLSGDGGDEAFAGYERYSQFVRTRKIKNLLKNIPFVIPTIKFLESFFPKIKIFSKIRDLLIKDDLEYFINHRVKSRMTNLMKRKQENVDIYEKYYNKLNRSDIVKCLQYLEFKTILPGRMMYKLDRMSMYYSIEARPPILDHHVLEKAFKIPSKLNMRNNKTKAILKSLLTRDFPVSFIEREKKGFGSPIKYWFENMCEENIFGCLKDEMDPIYSFIDYEKTLNMFGEIKNGFQGGDYAELWRLLVLSKFLKNNIDIIEV